MDSPRQQRLGLVALAAAVLTFATFLIQLVIPGSRTEQWGWILQAIQTAVTVAMVIYLVRLVRKQRDDYWRERGKDPKHPEP